MTVKTFTVPTGYESGNDSPVTFTADDRVSLAPLTAEAALRGLLMSREINADPQEVASLRQSREQYEEGDTDCLADGESAAADIDSNG